MEKLENWRKQIDAIDEEIISILSKRMIISKKIGKFKKENNLSNFDKKRWEEILKTNLKKGEKLGLSVDFITRILKLLHKYSLEIQSKS